MKGLLGRLAARGRGTDGKPFDYQTQCAADARSERVQQTLDELSRAIKAKEAQAATQGNPAHSDGN